MTWPEIVIHSWGKFLDEVEMFGTATAPLKRNYIFRGQADAGWSLQPTLARLMSQLGASEEKAADIEQGALVRFKAQAHLHPEECFVQEHTDPEWWTTMQHHGAPTRLLDWTHSPLVAAYFAVNSHTGTDAAIWAVHRRTLVALSDPSLPPHREIFTSLPQLDGFLSGDSGRPRIFAFDREYPTSRMVAQQGTFTVSNRVLADHANLIDSILSPFESEGTGAIMRTKYIIPAAQKRLFLKQLYFANIRADSLFPGIDGLGRTIDELIRISL